MDRSLASTFLARTSPEAVGPVETAGDLEARLAQVVALARAAWPDVPLGATTFVAHLAARVDAADPVSSFERLRHSDLYLACACGQGSAAALAAFESSYGPVLHAALSQVRSSSASRDEVLQHLREKLFVGDGAAPPKIDRYRGGGSLAGWLRVVTVREALMMIRRDRRMTPTDDVAAFEAAGGDPELDHIKARYHQAFRDAVRCAFGALEVRQRNLLRQHHLDGVTLDELARLYAVHRTTVARWLALARSRVMDETRAALSSQGSIGTNDVESIVRLLSSRFDMSIHDLLIGGGDHAE